MNDDGTLHLAQNDVLDVYILYVQSDLNLISYFSIL